MAEHRNSISVILPVFNDGPAALRCLDSIRGMVVPAGGELEIIAVDNGSTDDTRSRLAGLDGVTLLDEPRRGSYSARNRGAAAAGGAVLAFTDSDCVVDRGWGCAVLEALADERMDAVQGHTRGKAGQSVWSRYCGRQYAETQKRMTSGDVLDRADTRNFAVRRETFRRLGGFRTEWAHAADWEFGARMHRQGLRVGSAPAMMVTHHDPERLGSILDTRRAQAACLASMCDTIPWLRESRYLAPAKRWYHAGRRLPPLRWAIGNLLGAAEKAVTVWLERSRPSDSDRAGYRLFRIAGALAGAGGLYRPVRPLGGIDGE